MAHMTEEHKKLEALMVELEKVVPTRHITLYLCSWCSEHHDSGFATITELMNHHDSWHRGEMNKRELATLDEYLHTLWAVQRQ